MNNILIFSPTPSHPQNAGNRKRIYNVAKYLRNLGNKIHFIYFTQEGLNDKQKADMEKEWDSLTIIKKEKEYKLSGDYYKIDDWYQENIGKIVSNKCDEYNIDVIIVNYIFQSKLLELVSKKILKIIDTHDQFSNRHLKMINAGLKPDFFFTIPSEEKIGFDRADLVLAIQDREANEFKEITKRKINILTHIENKQFLNKKYNSLKTLGFIGSGNSVNLKSINEFIEKFIKFIDKYNLNIKLNIAGSICSKISIVNSSINLLGFVDEEKDFYNDVDLVLNPLTLGTGLKIKSVEALSFGVPILSTKIGFEGLKSDLKAHDLDSIDEMLHEIKKIYQSPIKLNDLAIKSREIFENYEKEISNSINNIFNNKKSILIITHINFWELDLGSRYRLYYLLEYLNKYFKVKIAYINGRKKSDKSKIEKIGYKDDVIFLDELESKETSQKNVNNFIKNNTFLNKFYNKELYFKMNRLIENNNFDIVLYEYIHLTYFYPLFNESYNILDTIDIMYKRYEKFNSENKKHWIEITKKQEFSLYKQLDLILAIQKSEYKVMIENSINAILVPHANKITYDENKYKSFKSIVFVGGLTEANVDALEFLLIDIWPIFSQLSVTFNICGTVCESQRVRELKSNFSNVHLLGKVDDLEDLYLKSNCVLNPVKIGGGLKIKNVEALCNGLILITTDQGAYGIEDGANEAYLVANTKDELIDLLLSVTISQDLRKQLSINAIEYAKDNFNDDVCYGELVKKIKEINR